MSSMLLATVSRQIASQMHQVSGGVPFFVEESTRWLLTDGTLTTRNGACVVNTTTGRLDLQVEIGKGIVARAALQGEMAALCLKLLAVCARPIELAHLQHAIAQSKSDCQGEADKHFDLHRVLNSLEQEQFVVPVAGNRPRYVLAHDRIREALFDSICADERILLHTGLGNTFAEFLFTAQATELAVLSAVHLNATPVPKDLAARMLRCDVNLRAAEVARQVADFAQALTFLNAAEVLLLPDLFADHARGMRLAYQRALTFGAMLRHSECLHFAQQAMQHARNLVEESQASVLAIRAMTMLTRYDDAIDVWIDLCNRLDPGARVPRNPGIGSVIGDVLSISRQIQRAGVEKVLFRVEEREDPNRDLIYQLLSATADAVFMARPLLFSKLPRQGIRYLLTEGASVSCRSSVVHVVILAAVTLSIAGKIELAIEVGKAARRLLETASCEDKGRPLFMLESFLRHLDEPLQRSLPLFLQAAAFSQQAQDTAYQGYALFNEAFARDWLGEPLDRVNADYRTLANLPAVRSSLDISDWIFASQQLRAALQDQAAPSPPMAAADAVSKTATAIRCTLRLRGAALGAWPGPYAAAEYGFPAFLTLNMGLGGVFTEGIAYFHAGLVHLGALRGKLSLLDRLHFRAAAEFVTYNVRIRARHNPTDYAHRIALLDAEHLRNRARGKTAVPLYEKAAHLAQQNGWPNEAALVLEKFTEVLIELGDLQRARVTAQECIELYKRWQAFAKVRQIEQLAKTLSHRK